MVKHLTLIVEMLDGTIHWINLYLVDNAICFDNTHLLDSNLSVA